MVYARSSDFRIQVIVTKTYIGGKRAEKALLTEVVEFIFTVRLQETEIQRVAATIDE